MKFFAVFAAVLALASANPSVWTLQDLSAALENPSLDSAIRPVLNQALDIYMDAIYQGNENPIKITTAPGQVTFTLSELDYTLMHTPENSLFRPYLEEALNVMMESLFAGIPMETIDVKIPSFELSYWSLQEIDLALSTESTNPALVPYLEQAMNELMQELFNGGSQIATVLMVPADLVASPVVDPSPVVVGPASPATPAPVPASNSPLVQIIVNVAQSNAVDVVPPTHVIERPDPQPSHVIERPDPQPSDYEAPPQDIIAVLPIEDIHPQPIVGPMV